MIQKVPGPSWEIQPHKGYPALKFQKSSAPRKHTSSKFSCPP